MGVISVTLAYLNLVQRMIPKSCRFFG